jgi:hypothetical protein
VVRLRTARPDLHGRLFLFFSNVIAPPDTGGYTLRVDPRADTFGTISFNLLDVPADPVVVATADAGPVQATTTRLGQNVVFTFDNATPGTQVTHTLSTDTGTVDATLTSPVSLVENTLTTSGSNMSSVITLNDTGTYTLEADLRNDSVTTISLQVDTAP